MKIRLLQEEDTTGETPVPKEFRNTRYVCTKPDCDLCTLIERIKHLEG